MRAKLTTVVLFGFVLIAATACGGGGDSAKISELETRVEEAEEARKEADEKAAEAERKRKEAEAKADDAEEKRKQAEEKRQEEEEKRQEVERERQRLAEEERKRQQAASRTQAKAAFDGLGGAAAGGTRSDPGTVTVAPRYGQTATVTTTTTATFASKRRSSSGRWSITTLSNDGITHKDDLVVYSDIGGPTRVLITEHSTYATRFTAVGNTNNIRASLSGSTEPIASSRFPGGARSTTFEHTIDSDPNADGSDSDGNTKNDYDTTRFSGTFDGASGTFECTGTCTITHRGGSTYDLTSGTWTFTTPKTARVPVADMSYMYFGWWKRAQKSDESLSFEMFSGGMLPVGDIPDVLTGTATYAGPAVGQYAIYQPLGTQSESGSFTARAELTANFGATTVEGTLSGRVTNFSNASDWSIALKSQTIDGGAVADGDVSWTIAGNTEDGGMWDAAFFSDTAYPDTGGHIPQGVAGTFDARFGTVGRLIGAFGAHCPASTCPSN